MNAIKRDISELRTVSWKVLSAIAELHAVADEASNGLGLLGVSSLFDFQGELRLTRAGSLATFSPDVLRVLPKLHTPRRGMTLRSSSHYLSLLRSNIGVKWLAADARMLTDNSRRERKLGLLLVPWPFQVSTDIVRPAEKSCRIDMPKLYQFFDFSPTVPFDFDIVTHLLTRLGRERKDVDGIVLPECALTKPELEMLLTKVQRFGVGFVLAGIRGERENYAVVASPQNPSRRLYQQQKHHRWCLDRAQIQQYGFSQLDEEKVWWENIKIGDRNVHFVALTDWLTMCHVICEDLARLDPVEQVIRAVGPNLLVALLQDGPQLKARWASRFASVYSDDPGCSVLTLTSLGMSTASRENPQMRHKPSRVVGRWVDPIKGGFELELLPRHHGIFLSVRATEQEEFTADGRSDHQTSSYLEYDHHLSV